MCFRGRGIHRQNTSPCNAFPWLRGGLTTAPYNTDATTCFYLQPEEGTTKSSRLIYEWSMWITKENEMALCVYDQINKNGSHLSVYCCSICCAIHETPKKLVVMTYLKWDICDVVCVCLFMLISMALILTSMNLQSREFVWCRTLKHSVYLFVKSNYYRNSCCIVLI